MYFNTREKVALCKIKKSPLVICGSTWRMQLKAANTQRKTMLFGLIHACSFYFYFCCSIYDKTLKVTDSHFQLFPALVLWLINTTTLFTGDATK